MSGAVVAGAGLRLDKWLWAARFFKTRALAVEAIERGRVAVNGQGAKPARELRTGDRDEGVLWHGGASGRTGREREDGEQSEAQPSRRHNRRL